MKTTPEFPCFQNTGCPCFGQNTECVLNIRVLCFEIQPLKSIACVKTQNTNRTLPKINPCFEIPPLVSIGYVKTQNTDFPTLRGRCPPRYRRERHHLPRGRFVTTKSSTLINQPKRKSIMAKIKTESPDADPVLSSTPPMDRTLLAIDLGTTSGWALRSVDGQRDLRGLITSGTVSFRPGRYDGGGMRYLRFQNWLGEMDRLAGPIGTIWFEEVRRHAGTDAAHVFGGFLATLTSWAELRGIPYGGVPVGTIKKFATGKGNASKAMMIEAAQARGYRPADDNEADAIAILHWAMETKGGMA